MKAMVIPKIDYKINETPLVVTAVRYEGLNYIEDRMGPRISVYFSIVASSVEYDNLLVFTLISYYQFENNEDMKLKGYYSDISLRGNTISLISSKVADMISMNCNIFAKNEDSYYLYGIEECNKIIYQIKFDSIQASIIGYIDQTIMVHQEINPDFLIDFVYPIRQVYYFSYRLRDKDPDHRINIRSVYKQSNKKFMVKFDVFNQRTDKMETMVLEPFVVDNPRLTKRKAIRNFTDFISPDGCINNDYRVCRNIILLTYYRSHNPLNVQSPSEMLLDMSMITNSFKDTDYKLIKFEPNYLSYKSLIVDLNNAINEFIQK